LMLKKKVKKRMYLCISPTHVIKIWGDNEFPELKCQQVKTEFCRLSFRI
jgi:hypothetical protein